MMAYQRAYFPMKVINLSQGYGARSKTHKLSYALDLSGKDSGKDAVYAPFDCKITKLYQPTNTNKNANTVWLTSTRKVLSPNGYYGYLTMSITHPSEITNMKLGTTFKQGELIMYEGRTGNASGNHIHIEVAKGTTAGWSRRVSGVYSEYVILNKVKPEDYLFVREDSIIKNTTYKGYKYHFIKESDITYKVVDVPSEPLYIHKLPNIRSSSIIKGVGLKNGDEVIKFYTRDNMAYIYHYEILGYTTSKYLEKKK